MANKIKYVQLEPAAFIIDCMHMANDEFGVYVRLNFLLYIEGGSLPNDPVRLARFCNTETETFEKIFKNVQKKFVLKNGEIRHKRVTIELKAAKERQQIASNKGLRGARSRWQRDCLGNGTGNGTGIAKLNKEKVNKENNIPCSSSINNSKTLKSNHSAISAAALGITVVEADKLITLWNQLSSKPVKGTAGHLAIEKLLSEVLQSQLGLTFDDIFQAVENYGKALKVRNTRAHAWNLHNFLLQIQQGKKTYLPGFFDIDNFKLETTPGKRPVTDEENPYEQMLKGNTDGKNNNQI